MNGAQGQDRIGKKIVMSVVQCIYTNVSNVSNDSPIKYTFKKKTFPQYIFLSTVFAQGSWCLQKQVKGVSFLERRLGGYKF